MRRFRAAAAVLLVLALSGCSLQAPLPFFKARSSPTPSASAANLTRFYGQRLAWRDCGGGFQCSTLRVPLDYQHPSGDVIGMAVIRHPATDPGHRIGSLLVNPGGPGGSGIGYARSASQIVSAALLADYDLVGFDPRGVGESTPVTCLDDAQMDAFVATVPDPQTQTEQDEAVNEAKLLAGQCEARSAKLLPHVSTVEVARDMDVLRQALGDARLTYLGKSYGTFLGATYADLFPSKVGRVVLDGALDPRLDANQLGLQQAAGIELAMRSFLADCVKRSDCPLTGDATVAETRVSALLASVRLRPIRGDGTRTVDLALAETGMIAALYTDTTWPFLRLALRFALQGDGRGLLQLADAYDDRGPDGHYQSNELAANYAVNCLDRPDVASVADVEARVPSYSQASPLFGAGLAWGDLVCAYWPTKATGRPHAISAAGAAPILVVGTIRDPATPYAWAQGLASQLASATLLTYDGDGHTAYRRGSTCIDSAVDAYFLHGTSPQSGLRCE
ncbi:MAG TPA: alpha/beta hydrolase [Terriglobales bacterium]|nr:alpha/beta hydrolase [Terriglobales bacterium]